jgi:hypothetical protein
MPNWDDWSGFPTRPCGRGVNAGAREISLSTTNRDRDDRSPFPPSVHAEVKALACQQVHDTGLPLSRQSTSDLSRRLAERLERAISRSTVWRILDRDAIRPWRHRTWVFPRADDFELKAGRILDLYAGFWEGQPLGIKDFVISADEKTSLQARLRCHATLPVGPEQPQRVEHEYERGGALQYLAAWDVRQARVFGRCEAKTGIAPFGRLVDQVMRQEPYASAERVFWIVDNGSSHRGQVAVDRLKRAYANAILVHTPVHASWLNQVEIYFSIIQRKVLTPNDFRSLSEIEERLLGFAEYFMRHAKPFDWKFNRVKLKEFLTRLEVARYGEFEARRRQLQPYIYL